MSSEGGCYQYVRRGYSGSNSTQRDLRYGNLDNHFLQRLHAPAPVNLAHRGARSHAPENTLVAFSRALEHGADGIELDIRLCGSQDWVVFHDFRLNRTTNGRGYVRTKPLYEIRRLDAGIKFGPPFHRQLIPTLTEVLEMARGEVLLNIEIKAVPAVKERSVAHLIDMLYRFDAERRCLISSFNPVILRRLARLDSSIPRGLLLTGSVLSRSTGASLRRITKVNSIHLHTRVVDARLAMKIKAMGLFVLVWGANTPEAMQRMIDTGVDGIITDEPLALSKILERGFRP